MAFEHPIWLILVIPLALAWWRWPAASPVLRVLRAVVLTLLVLALAQPELLLLRRAGTVVVVADRSFSEPSDAPAREREVISLLQQARRAGQRLAVVSFGRHAVIEDPGDENIFPGFTAQVDGDGSNLGSGLSKALALIPRGQPGRILVLSDGCWTGIRPQSQAWRAASRGVPIDYRYLARPHVDDLAIQRITAPVHVAAGESFLVQAWVHSPVVQNVHYQLRRDGVLIAEGKCLEPPGLSLLSFRDQARSPGVRRYTLSVRGAQPDPIPENNSARLLVGVDGPKSILLASDSPSSSLAALLTRGGLHVTVVHPTPGIWTLQRLANYSAVILDNVPSEDLGQTAMENLSAWVAQGGNGLLMTGGQRSFGPGGYYKSPLDHLLPISMELRAEVRKLSVAIVATLDRSGSMAMGVGGGMTKMDLADQGVAAVLKLLSPMDQFGVIAVDTQPHIIVPFGRVPLHKGNERNNILRIASMGGGIYIDKALEASLWMIQHARAGTRHIVLFADASDAEEPGDYRTLVKQCVAANVTISVIGMGTAHDRDANLLRDIARRGHGKIYFAANPQRLPQLFAQDTFLIARSTFINHSTPVRMTGGLRLLTDHRWPDPPPVGGYNLCYLRHGANLAAVTRDRYKAPLIATWQAGLGRVACYTGEADGKFTGTIASWKDVGQMFSSLVRWTAHNSNPLPHSMLLTQRVTRGMDRIALHLDPDHSTDQISALPSITTLVGRPGRPPAVIHTLMHWSSPDTLIAEIPLSGSQAALPTVVVSGFSPVTLTPVCLPYSPEFAPAAPGTRGGLATLRYLAKVTGGMERTDLGEIWSSLPTRHRLVSMTAWMILIAVGLILLEVTERRTGALGLMARALTDLPRPWSRREADVKVVRDGHRTSVSGSPSPGTAEKSIPTPENSKSKITNQKSKTPDTGPPVEGLHSGVLDAMHKIRHRHPDDRES